MSAFNVENQIHFLLPRHCPPPQSPETKRAVVRPLVWGEVRGHWLLDHDGLARADGATGEDVATDLLKKLLYFLLAIDVK